MQWQASSAPPMAGQPAPPANTAGEPTLWPFPEALQSIAATSGTTPYKLVTMPTGMGPEAPETNVAAFEWATLVPFRISTISASATTTGTSVVINGADQNGRKLLLGAWESLLSNPTGADLFILYAPNGASANPSGLASDVVDPAKTFILKSNLSTETTSNTFAMASAGDTPAPLAGDYYAAIDAPLQFLQLLWEASVTGTGGFVLNYQTASGATLPSSVFSQTGESTIWLLVILKSQSAATNPVRRFFPFNNVAILADNIDTSATNLFAEASDGSKKTRVASIAPGNAGFTAALANPTVAGEPTPDQRTQELFSCFGFEIVTAGNFSASNEGLPAGPLRPEEGADASTWSFKQVFAASRRANEHPLPDTPALPASLGDPYAGIGKDSDVTIQFNFLDIYGNETTPSPAVDDLPIAFGYTDDVIGVTSWPGLALSYGVAPLNAMPAIGLSIGLRYTTYVAGTESSFATSVVAAASHASRYAQVYYQLQQSDVGVKLTTSLDAPGGIRTEYALDRWLFTDVVNGAFAFLTTASWLTSATYTTAGSDTLGGVATAYGTTSARMLSENRELQALDVFAAALTVPVYHVAAAGDTLQKIATAAGLTIEALLALGENANAPVPATTNLFIPPVNVIVQPGDTLAAIASANGCNVADIADANAATPILTGGLVITIESVSVLTNDASSFNDVVTQFAAEYLSVSVAQIADAMQNVVNFILAGSTLVIDRRILVEASTLANLAASFSITPAALATLNQSVENLLVPSFPLLTGTTTVAPVAGETIGSFAEERNRVSVSQLASVNDGAALNAAVTLAIPLQTSFSAAAPVPFVPVRVQQGQSLDDLAAIFTNDDAMALAELDQAIAGTINGGQPVTIGTTTITTEPGDSIDAILGAFAEEGESVDLAQVVNAIGASKTMLRAGSVFLVPAPAAKSGDTPATASIRCGITLDEFANANAAMWPLLTTGVTIEIDDVSVTVGAQDTLAKLVDRFARDGVVTTVVELCALPEITLVADARFLLPPPPAEIVVPLTSSNAFPSALFAVEVEVTIGRDLDLVDDAFKSIESVRRARAPFPPNADPQQGALSLTTFATLFEAAFGGSVKAASSRGLDAEGNETRQIWAVNFGAGGITDVTLRGSDAAYFAFRPLSTQLESRAGVPIQPYDPATGLGEAEDIDFSSVDMEVWMRDFLGAVDLFLSPAYATGAFLLAPPQNFDDAVGYKDVIANGLSNNVIPILDSPAPQGNVAAAQEAIRQKLLVGLSSAYATNAIVQVPATVTSTLPATPGNRLSGKPQSNAYVTGEKDGFAEIASWYAVSEDVVALTLAEVVAILNTGVVVTYTPPETDAKTYTIQPDDTLRKVADHVGAASVELLTQYLTWPSDTGLFLPATAIPASKFAVAVPDAGASLRSLGDYFVVTVEDLAIANEDVDGIFSATSITIDGVTKSVTAATNSIRKMAAEFSMSVADFARAVQDQVNVWTIGITWTVMSRIPDHTVSVAKVALQTGTPALNFLFTTPAARDFRSMWLNVDYVVNELEYGIRPVPDVTGYEDSSWLTFILPIGSSPAATPSSLHTNIGTLRVPLPLRDYPAPPVLGIQSGTQTTATPSNVVEAKAWTYAFDYYYDEAAQDTLTLSTIFNEEPVLPAAFFAVADLFPALAQFAAVYQQLKPELALLVDPLTASIPDKKQRAQVAIETMTDLIGRVAAVWAPSAQAESAKPAPRMRDANAAPVPPMQTFLYEARDTTKDAFIDGVLVRVFDTFILTIDSGQSAGPGNAFPNVFWVDESGNEFELSKESQTATSCTYRYLETVDVRRRIAHRLKYPNLDIIAFQSGRSGMHITRNKALILPPSTTQSGPATANAFIYQTPEVAFADRLLPLIQQIAPVDINLTGNMTTDLRTMFTDLLGAPPNNYTIRLSVEYGYQLVTALDGAALTSRLPVVFRPIFQYADSGTEATVETLVAAVDAWSTGKNLPSTGARYLFNVSFFSSLDTSLVQPLLVITTLDWALSE
jgi:LysM repeat protein